ncbi:hypothetical protein G3I40_31190, partial [Streptomyces sp. SID14478]|uniref:Rv1733c family protein n=1 Tax=Streptomyces sp. SID14478 TaxID=2706073 RepID=UPI0013DD83FC
AARVFAVLALLVAPAAGVLSGWAAHADARVEARSQQASRHEQRAELRDDAPQFVPFMSGAQDNLVSPVAVRWTDPAGRTITVLAPVPAGLKRGDGTTVWLDAQGDVTVAPWRAEDIWSHTFAAGFLVAVTVAAVAVTGRLVLRRVLDRRRLAGWARDWRRVAPDGGPRPP